MKKKIRKEETNKRINVEKENNKNKNRQKGKHFKC